MRTKNYETSRALHMLTADQKLPSWGYCSKNPSAWAEGISQSLQGEEEPLGPGTLTWLHTWFRKRKYILLATFCLPSGSDSKESACNAGDPGLIPALGRSSGEGDGNTLQCSSLENPMDREAWWVTGHRVAQTGGCFGYWGAQDLVAWQVLRMGYQLSQTMLPWDSWDGDRAGLLPEREPDEDPTDQHRGRQRDCPLSTD